MYDDVDMGGDVDDFDFDAPTGGQRGGAQNPSLHGFQGQGAGQGAGHGGVGRFGFDAGLDLDLDQLTGDLGMGMGLGDDLLLGDMMGGTGVGGYPVSSPQAGADALAWDAGLAGAGYDVVGASSAAVPIVKAEGRRGAEAGGAYAHGVPGASPATSGGLAGMPPAGRGMALPPGVPAGAGTGVGGRPPLPPVSEVPSSTPGAGAGAGAGAGGAPPAELSAAEIEDGLAKFKKGFRSGNKDASINVAVRDTRLPFGAVLQVMWASKPRLQRRNVKTHPMRLLRSMLRAYMSRDNLPRTPQSQHLSSRHFFRAFLAGQPEPGTRLISLVQSMLPPHERVPAAIAQDLQLTFNLLVDDASSDDSGRLTISQAVDAMYCATCDELMCYRGCRVRHHGSRSGGGSTAGDVPMRAKVRARSRTGSAASAGAGGAGAGAGAPPLGSSPGTALRGGRVDTRERNKKRTRDRAASRPVDPSRPQVPVAGCPATWLKPPLIAFQEYSGPTDVDVELMGRSVVDKIWSPPVARVQSCPMHYDALLFVTGEAPPLDSSDPHMTVDVFTKGKASVLPELTFDIYYEDLGNANPQETQLTVPSHDGAADQFRGPGGADAAGGRARKRQSTRGSPWDSWGGDPVVSNGTYRVFRSLCTSALDLLEHTARARIAAVRAGKTTAVASSSLAPVFGAAVEECCVALCRAMYCVAIAQYDPAAFWSSISDAGGVTLLHVAAALGCERVVNTMLQSGADASAASVAGTPAQLAVARGFEDIAATLTQDPDSEESAMSSVNGRDVRRGPNFAGRELLSMFKATLRVLRAVALPEASVASTKRVDPAAGLCRHLMRGTCVLSAMFEGDHTFLWGRLVSSSGWQLLHAAAALGAHTTVLGLYNLGADMWACPEARRTEQEIAAGLESQTPSPGSAAVVAAAYGHTAMAQFLRPYPASVGARTSDSDTDAASAGAGNMSIGSPPSRHMSLAERVRRASGFSADPILASHGKGSAGHGSAGHGSAGLMSAASTAYPPTVDMHHKLTSKRAAGSIGYGTVGSYAPSSQPYEHRSSRSSAASSTRSDKSANRDEYSMTMFRHSSGAFVVMILLGLAMLLPWNIIVFAGDYFDELYPHQSFEFLGAAAYIVPQLPVAVLMWRYGDKVSVITRLVSALVAQTVVLLAIPEVAQNVHDLSMVVCLLLIALSGLVAQITISSTIGFASQLPPICTQAVMVGLGGTGLLGAIARIGTKAGIAQYAHSGLAFFVVGAIFVAAAAVGLLWLSNTPFTEYHMKKAQHRRSVSRPTTAGPRRRVWAPLIPDVEQGDTPVEHGSWQHFSFLSGKVWAYAASAALVFFTTFVLWPGELTNIPYKNTFSAFQDLQDAGWWPLVLLTVFNVFDLAARCLPPKAYYCGEKFALLSSILRCMFFLPVFVYAASTHDEMVFNDLVAVVAVAFFAASNGYLATVALQCAPAKVPVSEKEATGFFMTLFLQSGSFMGTIAALALDRMHVHAAA